MEKIGARLAAPPVDFNEIDQLVHQFKGSSASFGARRMADLCIHMREACQAHDSAACRVLLQQVAEQFRVRSPLPETHAFTNACVQQRFHQHLHIATIMRLGQQASPANPGQHVASCLYVPGRGVICASGSRVKQACPAERTC